MRNVGKTFLTIFSFRKRENDSQRQLVAVREVHRHLLQQSRDHRRRQDPTIPSGEIQDRAPEHQREELSHLLLHAGGTVAGAQGQARPQGCHPLQIPHRGKFMSPSQ